MPLDFALLAEIEDCNPPPVSVYDQRIPSSNLRRVEMVKTSLWSMPRHPV